MTLSFRRRADTHAWALGSACGMLAALVLECAGVPDAHAFPLVAHEDDTRTMPMTVQRTHMPEPPRTFVSGPPIRPAAPLLVWLEQYRFETWPRKQDRRVRLPVVLRLDKAHTHIIEAFIGVTDTVDADTIFLRLDDSSMGISLMDRLEKPCLRANPACMIWLEGHGKTASNMVSGFPIPIGTEWTARNGPSGRYECMSASKQGSTAPESMHWSRLLSRNYRRQPEVRHDHAANR